MKPASELFFTFIISFLFSLSGKAQEKKSKYTDYDRGYYLYYYNKKDSAFLMLNRYVNNADDTLKKGRAYNLMAEIQWGIGDLYGAQQSLTDVIKTLDPQNAEHLEEIGYAYNVLGNVSHDLKQYDEAIGFYEHILPFFRGTDFANELLNGKATALQKKGSYVKAIALYDSILALQPNNQMLVARVMDNRARTKWLANPRYPALPEYWSALKIRTDSAYSIGLNASYAHLSEYYEKINPDSALFYAMKMRQEAIKNESPDDILEAVDKLIRLNNSPGLKGKWYDEFKRLNDSVQLSRDTTRNRFALIRYDVQKSKADNLSLQQDVSRQRLLVWSVAILAVLIITGFFFWYRRRRERMRRESDNAIKAAKLKTSKKVHDVVANGLYTIMNELEHSRQIEREPLISRIEGLYEKSRDISYEDDGNNFGEDDNIPGLLSSFANNATKVILVGNEEGFWQKISSPQKQELGLVLNELMVNMKKHSGAKNVVIHFQQENGDAIINYKDDGTGFPAGYRFGNGLKNTVNRINSLSGKITFDKNEKAGAIIRISFPLNS